MFPRNDNGPVVPTSCIVYTETGQLASENLHIWKEDNLHVYSRDLSISIEYVIFTQWRRILYQFIFWILFNYVYSLVNVL